MSSEIACLVGELEKIEDEAELSSWKRNHKSSSELVRGIVARIQDLFTVDRNTAARLSQSALSIALDLDDPFIRALAYRARGGTLSAINDHFQSIEHYERALAI